MKVKTLKYNVLSFSVFTYLFTWEANTLLTN